jgi:dolichyl-phosphate beta-glucosyltransferase
MEQATTHQGQVDTWIAKQPVSQEIVELSVVVPAYNEQRRLPLTLIEMIDYLDSRAKSYEVIVVDDGSFDGTADLVKKFERVRERIRLIRSPRNYGKGHAVKMGMLNARGQKVLFADADGSSPVPELERLEQALAAGADLAIGSRAKKSQDTSIKTVWYRKYLGRMFNACVNWVLLPEIADTQCGFKFFTKNAARFLFEHQTANGFSFDVEILYLARRAGLKIEEVPINWENVAGSKVNLLLDPLRMFRDILRFRLKHRAITPQLYQEEVGKYR